MANFDLGNSGDKRQSAAFLTSKTIAADRSTPPPEAMIHGDVSQGLKGKTHTRNQKTKMASRSLKGTCKSSSSKWKVLKSPSLRDPSITPFELHTKDKSPFDCAEIKKFKAGSSETKPDLQIGDKECSNLDDMELEYNPTLFGGDMKDCSSVLSYGELGRTPFKEVSNLSNIRVGNKISGVEAAVNSISRAMLKHIDPKARAKGVDRKEGDVVMWILIQIPNLSGLHQRVRSKLMVIPNLMRSCRLKQEVMWTLSLANFCFSNFLVDMNILIWKPGALNPTFINVVNDLVLLHSPAMMIISETKVGGLRAKGIAERLPFDGAICTNIIGLSRGLWLLWDSNRIEVTK